MVTRGASRPVRVTAVSASEQTRSDTVQMVTTTSRLTGVSLSMTPAKVALLGSPISLVAATTPAGLTGVEYLYKVGVQSGGAWSWTILRSWSPTVAASWTPVLAGNYSVLVYAREAGSVQAYQVFKSYAYLVSTLSAVDLTATPPSSIGIGTRLTFIASATGGCDLRYRFRIGYADATGWHWTELTQGTYTTANTCTWTPTAARSYACVVYVRENGSLAMYQVYKSLAVTVK
jgi:hypothetical protein